MDTMILYAIAALNLLALVLFVGSELTSRARRRPPKVARSRPAPDETAAELADLIDQVERMAADSCRRQRQSAASQAGRSA